SLEVPDLYVWIDVSCLPGYVTPQAKADGQIWKGQSQAVINTLTASEAAATPTEEQVKERTGRRARTIRALPLYLLCCDLFLAVDEQEPVYWCSPWTRLERAALREAVALTSGGGATKAARAGHPRMLKMRRDEVVSFMGLSRRSKATVTRQSSSVGVGGSKPEPLLPPFGQGFKVGASGIGPMDVPAMKTCYELLEGLSLVRDKVARYPCMDIPRLTPEAEQDDKPIPPSFNKSASASAPVTTSTVAASPRISPRTAETEEPSSSSLTITLPSSKASSGVRPPMAIGVPLSP
ncbi:unnamed protein product, partial [Sphacelaria rigidula]